MKKAHEQRIDKILEELRRDIMQAFSIRGEVEEYLQVAVETAGEKLFRLVEEIEGK